ncbi:hypothetical protein SBV1_410070 [Verrucomicrobia bacterium]|nr:hypothetical protein SBV1_410070 [Verrucomicrobiota bacterium]
MSRTIVMEIINELKRAEPASESIQLVGGAVEGSLAFQQELLSRAWEIYRKEHLVFDQPHVIVQDKESGDKPRFIEIFTWVSHSAPEHAPGSVKTIWDQMQSQCEARDGHGGLVGGEVDLLAPKAR